MTTAWWLIVGPALACAEWQQVLDAHRRDSGQMDYVGLQASGLADKAAAHLSGAAEPEDAGERMAFWINAYNALTVDLVVDSLPLGSIRDLEDGQVWRVRRFPVAGRRLTLDEIQHQILKPLGDVRTHFAINCAAKSCPPLRPQVFEGSKLESQLDEAVRAWLPLHGVAIDRAQGTLLLSSLFDWYADEFKPQGAAAIPQTDPRLQGVLNFIAQYLSDSDASWVMKGGYAVRFVPYDWGLNDVAG